MRRPGIGAVVAAAAGLFGIVAFIHRGRRVATGSSQPGGVVMGDVGGYDLMSRLFLGSLFRGVARDVVATSPPPARVLEVGCGPGRLSIELARSGFEVTGLDLDPAMVDRARVNADRAIGASSAAAAGQLRPTFAVGDVAALPFDDASYDLVVSTFSMHHWADRSAGLAEIARVVRPGGRILVWDLRPGAAPFHGKGHRAPDHGPDVPLGPPRITPWKWPFRWSLADRFEFVRP